MGNIKNIKDVVPVIRKESLIRQKGSRHIIPGTQDKLTGAQKAALFLVSLGSDTASNIIKYLKEEESEKITEEIAKITNVRTELKEKILKEFQTLIITQQNIQRGGQEYAKEILVKALGEKKAEQIMGRVKDAIPKKPFLFAAEVDAEQLKTAITNEHPQTISLILSYIAPQKAAEILKNLPSEIQTEVVKRMATMSKTDPNILREIENVLMNKLSSLSKESYTTTDGISTVASILNKLDSNTEKDILSSLEEENPALTDKIKDKLFIFDDITTLDDIAIQLILREIEHSDLVKALKGTSEDIQYKFFRNMSKRSIKVLKDDMEFIGPLRLSEVEEARQKIVNIIRKLEEENKIIIFKTEKDEIIV